MSSEYGRAAHLRRPIPALSEASDARVSCRQVDCRRETIREVDGGRASAQRQQPEQSRAAAGVEHRVACPHRPGQRAEQGDIQRVEVDLLGRAQPQRRRALQPAERLFAEEDSISSSASLLATPRGSAHTCSASPSCSPSTAAAATAAACAACAAATFASITPAAGAAGTTAASGTGTAVPPSAASASARSASAPAIAACSTSSGAVVKKVTG
eukprot:scaffold69883_cov60-Phaeocystis_antarctica.AAC.3